MSNGVLFDVDGTLIDSNYLHAVAWWQAFRRSGLDVPMNQLHRAIGMGSDQLVPHMVKENELTHSADSDDELAEDLGATHDAVYSTYWPALRCTNGASALVTRCHDAGLVTVLASSAGPDDVAVVQRVLDVDDHLSLTTDASDGDQSKPEPDLIAVALERAGLAAESSVFIGDSIWDVAASARAGLRCVALECGGTSRAELLDVGAMEVHRDPAALLEQWDDSVLATVAAQR